MKLGEIKEKVCLFCGEKFEATVWQYTKKYCDDRCRASFYRQEEKKKKDL